MRTRVVETSLPHPLLTVLLGLVLWLSSLSSGQAQLLEWAKRAGGTGGESGSGIAVDGSGNSYVTGVFSGTATFGPGEGSQTLLTSAAGSFPLWPSMELGQFAAMAGLKGQSSATTAI